jgi:hypothetical protein
VEGPFESVREVSDASEVRPGWTPRVQLTGDERQENFGLRLDGWLQVPVDDLYIFELTSDDGSHLYLNNELLIDHDGFHGATEKTGMVALARGHHRLRVLFFQSGGGRDLALRVRRGDGPFEPVPDEWFSVEELEEW